LSPVAFRRLTQPVAAAKLAAPPRRKERPRASEVSVPLRYAAGFDIFYSRMPSAY